MDYIDDNTIGRATVSLKAAERESDGFLAGGCVSIHGSGAGLADGETGRMKGALGSNHDHGGLNHGLDD